LKPLEIAAKQKAVVGGFPATVARIPAQNGHRAGYSMITKSGFRFSEKTMLHQEAKGMTSRREVITL